MESKFKKLTQLLKIESDNDLFDFENGKMKPYKSKLDFQYHLTNLHELVLSEVSNTVHPTKNLIIDTYSDLIEKLRNNHHRILRN